jgi:predicted nucleic acid-binding protein
VNLPEWFADTGYWIALANTQDELHQRARTWSRRIRARLVTTDAVLLEVADAFAGDRWRSVAVALIEDVLDDPEITVVPLDRPLFIQALALYRSRADKEWGLTDCISFVVMQERGITEALAYDQHFVQAGFSALLRAC